MENNAKIYVAGHKGLVGSALLKELHQQQYHQIVTRSHAQLDLTNQQATLAFFEENQPQYVFLAAAKVGGIWANNSLPADFIEQNLQIQNNVLSAARTYQVKRLLFLGSSCIYPRDCAQPIKEEYLLTGPLESTNRPYALAKIAGIEMCWAYNRQYQTKFLAIMPTNLYGPGDNYDLDTSHVIPALIRKMHEAKIHGSPTVSVWGTGLPRREFLYSEELAKACIYLIKLPEEAFNSLVYSSTHAPTINIGFGQDLTIQALAELIANVVGFKGKIQFDTTKPDGTPRKILCIDKIQDLGWRASLSLEEGIKLAYQDFKMSVNYQNSESALNGVEY